MTEILFWSYSIPGGHSDIPEWLLVKLQEQYDKKPFTKSSEAWGFIGSNFLPKMAFWDGTMEVDITGVDFKFSSPNFHIRMDLKGVARMGVQS